MPPPPPPPPPPPDPFESDQETRAGGVGKFLLLSVPDFKGDGSQPMNTYLRLGDAALHAGRPDRPDAVPLGEDLAGMVQGFTDDTRPRALSPAPSHTPAPGDVCPHESSSIGVALDAVEMRRLESTKLHTKGGWRDHSDGNRITTTRGDKVEVVRGNYKLVVLGRSDGWGNAAGLDISGGNVDPSSADLQFASDPDDLLATDPETTLTRRQKALEVQYEWHADADGRWGWTQTTTTGSEDTTSTTRKRFGEDPTLATPRDQAGNARVITRSFVDLLQSYTGSERKPVDLIESFTHARAMNEGVHVGQEHAIDNSAGSQHETLTVTGEHTVTTHVGSEGDLLTSDGDISTTIVAQTLNETYRLSGDHNVTTNVSKFSESLSCQTHDTTNTALAVTEINLALITFTMQMALMIAELKIGVHADLHLGSHLDIHCWNHSELHIGTHMQVKMLSVETAEVDMSAGAMKTFFAGMINLS